MNNRSPRTRSISQPYDPRSTTMGLPPLRKLPPTPLDLTPRFRSSSQGSPSLSTGGSTSTEESINLPTPRDYYPHPPGLYHDSSRKAWSASPTRVQFHDEPVSRISTPPSRTSSSSKLKGLFGWKRKNNNTSPQPDIQEVPVEPIYLAEEAVAPKRRGGELRQSRVNNRKTQVVQRSESLFSVHSEGAWCESPSFGEDQQSLQQRSPSPSREEEEEEEEPRRIFGRDPRISIVLPGSSFNLGLDFLSEEAPPLPSGSTDAISTKRRSSTRRSVSTPLVLTEPSTPTAPVRTRSNTHDSPTLPYLMDPPTPVVTLRRQASRKRMKSSGSIGSIHPVQEESIPQFRVIPATPIGNLDAFEPRPRSTGGEDLAFSPPPAVAKRSSRRVSLRTSSVSPSLTSLTTASSAASLATLDDILASEKDYVDPLEFAKMQLDEEIKSWSSMSPTHSPEIVQGLGFDLEPVLTLRLQPLRKTPPPVSVQEEETTPKPPTGFQQQPWRPISAVETISSFDSEESLGSDHDDLHEARIISRAGEYASPRQVHLGNNEEDVGRWDDADEEEDSSVGYAI